MDDMKIYMPGYYNGPYEGPEESFEANRVPILEALKLITDDYIDESSYSTQTIIDMRDCLIHMLNKDESFQKISDDGLKSLRNDTSIIDNAVKYNES
jgi:hypothetical protein